MATYVHAPGVTNIYHWCRNLLQLPRQTPRRNLETPRGTALRPVQREGGQREPQGIDARVRPSRLRPSRETRASRRRTWNANVGPLKMLKVHADEINTPAVGAATATEASQSASNTIVARR